MVIGIERDVQCCSMTQRASDDHRVVFDVRERACGLGLHLLLCRERQLLARAVA